MGLVALGVALAGFVPQLHVQSARAQTEKPAGEVAQGPAAPKPAASPIQIANLPLGVVTFPNGKAMNLSVAMGSAAYRHPGDSVGRLWLMTDRGPSVPCDDTRRLIGGEAEQLCNGDRSGRIYLLPGFAPSIYGIDISPDMVARISVFIPLKSRSGRPVSGRPNPPAAGEKLEPSFSTDGKPLPSDASGIDPEAFVKLADGSFWVAEEFGPSLLEVAPDGTILRRLVPGQVAASLKDADYEVIPSLPPVMRARMSGRGLEGLAISPDEKFLYVIMQSPLAIPDAETFKQSRNVRIWKIERQSGNVVGQYLYQLDPPAAFKGDSDGRDRPQRDVHVSELVAIGEDKLLVLERIDKTSRFFTVKLGDANRVHADFDQIDTLPSLEMLDGDALAMRGMEPLEKTLVLDSESVPSLPSRIEGVAVIAPDEMIIINDNDFAIDGVRTQMFRVTLPTPALR